MGTIKTGILGGFSGKVGPVVGGNWKGISYMRSIAASISNPRTEAQQKQRHKLRVAMSLLQTMVPFIRIGFQNYAVRQTAFNAAVSYIIKNAITGTYPDLELNYQRLLVSRGDLLMATGTTCSIDNSIITVNWQDNSTSGNASPTDIAMLLVYNASKVTSIYDVNAARRSDCSASIEIPQEWESDTLYVYLSFISTDGTLASNSTLVTMPSYSIRF